MKIYDEYENPVENAVSSFAPLRVVDERSLLSDGFTPIMMVQSEGKFFGIQLDNSGKLLTTGATGSLRLYRNVRPQSDSVVVRIAGRISFFPADGKRGWVTLPSGERFVRLFSTDGLDYVKRDDRTSSFGWVRLLAEGEGIAWSVIVPRIESGIPASIVGAVADRVERINRIFSVLHAYFSHESGRKIVAPYWRIRRQPNVVTCTLMRDSSSHGYPESTRLLARDLEQHIIGTGLRLTVSPRTIEIRRGS